MYKFSVQDPHFLPHCGCEIELTVAKGDFITLVGENGVGKSSFSRRLFQEQPEIFSYLQQGPLDFFYDRSLKTIKSIFLTVGKEEVSLAMFNHLWHAFHLGEKENRMQSSLSGGEAQALKLCLGLSVTKEIYLLDEPSQFLDSSLKEVLSQTIRELILKNRTILMIEHDLNWINSPSKVSELVLQENILKIRSSWTT